jgi:hypothetical protein
MIIGTQLLNYREKAQSRKNLEVALVMEEIGQEISNILGISREKISVRITGIEIIIVTILRGEARNNPRYIQINSLVFKPIFLLIAIFLRVIALLLVMCLLVIIPLIMISHLVIIPLTVIFLHLAILLHHAASLHPVIVYHLVMFSLVCCSRNKPVICNKREMFNHHASKGLNPGKIMKGTKDLRLFLINASVTLNTRDKMRKIIMHLCLQKNL